MSRHIIYKNNRVEIPIIHRGSSDYIITIVERCTITMTNNDDKNSWGDYQMLLCKLPDSVMVIVKDHRVSLRDRLGV